PEVSSSRSHSLPGLARPGWTDKRVDDHHDQEQTDKAEDQRHHEPPPPAEHRRRNQRKEPGDELDQNADPDQEHARLVTGSGVISLQIQEQQHAADDRHHKTCEEDLSDSSSTHFAWLLMPPFL